MNSTGQIMNSTRDVQSPECYIWKCKIYTNRGLLQQLNTCRRNNNITTNVVVGIDNQSAVVLTAIHVMPDLFLKKPSRK